MANRRLKAMETGKYGPSLPLAFRIAQLFGVTVEEVFTSPSRRQSKAS